VGYSVADKAMKSATQQEFNRNSIAGNKKILQHFMENNQ
jgi:hypothetical protein